MQIIIKGLIYESCLEYCQKRAISNDDKQIDFEFTHLLDETKLNRSDSSLLSWLQSIPNDTFNFQFEDKKLNVKIEKLDKPSLIANWSEMMLTSPIKPKKFPHNATPFTRLRATDLMSKSLTSGIVDGLSKSIMSFSLKDAVDMSHSSIATTEFHLNHNQSLTDKKSDELIKRTDQTKSIDNDDKNDDQLSNNDEKVMEKMFEEGNVFNSSMFGKLSTINEDKCLQNKENQDQKSIDLGTKDCKTDQNEDNQSFASIEEMKQQLEQFADAQWKEFLRKKDELLMSSVTKSMINELTTKQTTNRLMTTTINSDHLTPVTQIGQTNFKDLESLKFTSTPKATPNQPFIEQPIAITDYNPVKLNFSGISSTDHSSTNRSNTMISDCTDFQNQKTKLAANNFDLNVISPKNPSTSRLTNLSNHLNVSSI